MFSFFLPQFFLLYIIFISVTSPVGANNKKTLPKLDYIILYNICAFVKYFLQNKIKIDELKNSSIFSPKKRTKQQ